MKQYYITKPDGQHQGPLDEAFVREQYAAGSYGAGTQVWTEGMPDFAPIDSVFAGVTQPSASVESEAIQRKQYHIATPDGQQHGPLDEQIIREQYAAGVYTDEAMVWTVGMPAWVPIASVFPDEKPLMPQPPPFRPTPSVPPPAPVPPSGFSMPTPTNAAGNIGDNKVLNELIQYLISWRNIFQYQGRASRKEYWMTVLAFVITLIISATLMATIGVIAEDTNSDVLGLIAGLFALIVLVFYVYWIAIGISLNCRRLHDLGHSGWLQLIVLIPYIGSIVLLVFMCMKGKQGHNKYGPAPLT